MYLRRKVYSAIEDEDGEVRFYSTTDVDNVSYYDYLLEKAFSDGFDYAYEEQREFANARQKKKNAKKVETNEIVNQLVDENSSKADIKAAEKIAKQEVKERHQTAPKPAAQAASAAKPEVKWASVEDAQNEYFNQMMGGHKKVDRNRAASEMNNFKKDLAQQDIDINGQNSNNLSKKEIKRNAKANAIRATKPVENGPYIKVGKYTKKPKETVGGSFVGPQLNHMVVADPTHGGQALQPVDGKTVKKINNEFVEPPKPTSTPVQDQKIKDAANAAASETKPTGNTGNSGSKKPASGHTSTSSTSRPVTTAARDGFKFGEHMKKHGWKYGAGAAGAAGLYFGGRALINRRKENKEN